MTFDITHLGKKKLAERKMFIFGVEAKERSLKPFFSTCVLMVLGCNVALFKDNQPAGRQSRRMYLVHFSAQFEKNSTRTIHEFGNTYVS